MAFDISALLAVDLAIGSAGAEVTAHRLTQDGPDRDGDYRYELAVRLEKRRRWPKGQYYLLLLDQNGLLLERAYVSEVRSTEKGVRQLEASAYSANISAAQLVLELSESEADEVDVDQPAEPDDGWVALDVIVDDSAREVGVKVDGLVAEAHADFSVSNLVLIEVRAALLPYDGAPLPAHLTASVVVRDQAGRVLNGGDVDLSLAAGRRALPFRFETNVYRHARPASVEITFGRSIPIDDVAPGMPPAYANAIMSTLKQIDAKLDRLLGG